MSARQLDAYGEFAGHFKALKASGMHEEWRSDWREACVSTRAYRVCNRPRPINGWLHGLMDSFFVMSQQ